MITLYREHSPLDNTGTLPPATLFTGPRWSGRMTLALEVARGSVGDAADKVISPDLLVLGNRDFMAPIRGVSEAALEDCTADRYITLIRNVRILLSRWNPFLYDTGESKYKKPIKLALELEEYLFGHEHESPSASRGASVFVPKGKKAETLIRGLVKKSEQLCKEMKQRNLTIGMIRNMESWIRQPPEAKEKVVIIEGVDEFSPAVANGLLKMLEEPPEYLRFILIGQSRSKVLPTILSRARHIVVPPYTHKETRLLLKQLFAKDIDTIGSLENLFLAEGGVELLGLKNLVKVLMETLTSSRVWGQQEMTSLIQYLSSDEAFFAFLTTLREAIVEAAQQSGGTVRFVSANQATTWYEIIAQAQHRYTSLKLSTSLVAEALCAELHEEGEA